MHILVTLTTILVILLLVSHSGGNSCAFVCLPFFSLKCGREVVEQELRLFSFFFALSCLPESQRPSLLASQISLFLFHKLCFTFLITTFFNFCIFFFSLFLYFFVSFAKTCQAITLHVVNCTIVLPYQTRVRTCFVVGHANNTSFCFLSLFYFFGFYSYFS